MEDNAKEVAGKSIGRFGLAYITTIVAMGVCASIVLDETKMAAVMGLLGASLTALISMLNNVAGTKDKEEKPEFTVIKELISRLDKQEPPMAVEVKDGTVTVTKGNDTTTMEK